MKPIYLDHAATTPLDTEVFEAMRPYLEDEFANPSSLYMPARRTRQAVEQARHQIAGLLGAKQTEIIFTSGGTESNNLAVQGVLRAHPNTHWITSAIEHDAVLGQAEPLSAQGHRVSVVGVQPNGIADPVAIEAAITDDTVLISLMLANNEIGTIQPVAAVAQIVQQVRQNRRHRGHQKPLYLHTDATQAANYLDLHVTRLGVDLLSLSGSKIYGPKGTGMLYARQGTQLEPLLYGGGQERGRRSGTENTAGAVGLATALEIVQSDRESEGRRLIQLRDEAVHSLLAAIPDASLNGDTKRRLPNNINLTIPGTEGEALVLYLEQAGILASTGSACSSGDLDPSHVLLALGRTPDEAAASLRLTLGRSTNPDATGAAVAKLPAIVARLREL